jgi:hypothetical protein
MAGTGVRIVVGYGSVKATVASRQSRRPRSCGGPRPLVRPPERRHAAGYGLSRRSLVRGGAALGVAGAVSAALTSCAAGFGRGFTGGGPPPGRLDYWTPFGGGDGRRMKEMVAAYQSAHPAVDVRPLTLNWGSPYYTKLSLAALGGDPPSVAIAHLSRLPTLARAGLIRELTIPMLAPHSLTGPLTKAGPITPRTTDWWRHAAIYQVSPRSFSSRPLRSRTHPRGRSHAVARLRARRSGLHPRHGLHPASSTSPTPLSGFRTTPRSSSPPSRCVRERCRSTAASGSAPPDPHAAGGVVPARTTPPAAVTSTRARSAGNRCYPRRTTAPPGPLVRMPDDHG